MFSDKWLASRDLKRRASVMWLGGLSSVRWLSVVM